MAEHDVVSRFWEVFEPELADQGYELVEVEYAHQGGTRILRVFIDRTGGVSLDDCQTVSRFLSPMLDAEDWIENQYMLEVSSPGFDRPVRKPADFQRFVGEPIKVQTTSPTQGRKRFHGTLVSYADGMLVVESDGSQYAIHLEHVKKANLDR
jgi:ribosome maturation factor RimP